VNSNRILGDRIKSPYDKLFINTNFSTFA
jgi:hypothetical protein